MAVTIQEPRGYPPAPIGGDPVTDVNQAASSTWIRRIVDVLNSVRQGKLNANLSVTLRTAHTTTDVIDARISVFSALLFTPQSAAAAAMLTALYPSNQNNGSVTLNHLSTADTCVFWMTIIA